MSNQAGLGIGEKVHNQEINEYPEEMREDYLKLSEWVRETYHTYGMKVWIRVIDPQSLVGLWKHVRYKVSKYPAFILDGEDVFKGWGSTPAVISRIEELISIRQ
jgi:hypothetical protein